VWQFNRLHLGEQDTDIHWLAQAYRHIPRGTFCRADLSESQSSPSQLNGDLIDPN
jgi:hypothetical protein